MPIAINLHPSKNSEPIQVLKNKFNTLRSVAKPQPHSMRMILLIHATAIALALLGSFIGSFSQAATETSEWTGTYLNTHAPILNTDLDTASNSGEKSAARPDGVVRSLEDRIEIQKLAPHQYRIHLKSYQSSDQSCEFEGVASDASGASEQEITRTWSDESNLISSHASRLLFAHDGSDGSNQTDRCELRIVQMPASESQIGRADSIRVITNDNCQSYCGAQATPEIKEASRSAKALLDHLLK